MRLCWPVSLLSGALFVGPACLQPPPSEDNDDDQDPDCHADVDCPRNTYCSRGRCVEGQILPNGGSSGVASGGGTSSGGMMGVGGVGNADGAGAAGEATGGTGAEPSSGGTNGAGAPGTTGGTPNGGVSGTSPTGGRGGSAGASGSAGKVGSGGAAGAPTGGCAPWPAASSSQGVAVSSTRQISGTFDGMLQRFVGSGPLGTGGQDEDQLPLFDLADGATLRNVILGSPSADGVHCQGSCTLENVWWEDVGEDAATFRGSSSSQQMTIRCSGARAATDKIFQHNGAGTLTLQDFFAESFGKLYRSCGNCTTQYARHVVLRDVTARQGLTLVGINANYGDTADFDRVTVSGVTTICERYEGNNTSAEPLWIGEGPDSEHCRYDSSDITQR